MPCEGHESTSARATATENDVSDNMRPETAGCDDNNLMQVPCHMPPAALPYYEQNNTQWGVMPMQWHWNETLWNWEGWQWNGMQWSVQLTLTGVCSMVYDFGTALFPFIDCRGLCSLNTASRRLTEQATGWHAAYACRFGMPPLENGQTIEAQGGWRSLYLRSHFLRIQPGVRALGIKRGTSFSSLQIDIDEPTAGEDSRQFELQLPVGTQNLRAAIFDTDLAGAHYTVKPDQYDCAFDERDDIVSTIEVYRADLGTLETEQNPNVVGIRVGITARELLASTGASFADIIPSLDENHRGTCFELTMIPNVQFTLDHEPSSDLDWGDNYWSVKWWELHNDSCIQGIKVDLRGM